MFVLDEDPAIQKKEREEGFMLMEQIIKEEAQYLQKKEDDEEKGFKVGAYQKQKQPKVSMSIKVTKNKKQIEKALKDFIPQGIKISRDQRPTQEEYRELIQVEDVEQFSLNYRTFLAKVIKVTDGDSIKVALRLTSKLSRFTFRLNGVDTPQCRSGQVKEFGQYVREVLRRMLEGKVVRIQAGQFDKYGRVLGRIFAYAQNQQFCVNDFLIENQLAKAYSGKTKDQFTKKDYEKFKKKFIRTSWPNVVHYPRTYFKENKDQK